MVNINKLYALLVLLKERSGLYTFETVTRNVYYLTAEERRLYKKEIKYLLDDLGVKEQPPC